MSTADQHWTDATDRDLVEVAEEVAHRASRNRPDLYEELRQRAAELALQTRETWRANPQGPMRPYVAAALRKNTGRWIIEMNCPLTGSARHGAQRMIDAKAAPEEVLGTFSSREDAADGALEAERWRVRVVARLLEIAGEEQEALEALLLGKSEGQLEGGAFRPKGALGAIVQRIERDPLLWQLWKERHE